MWLGTSRVNVSNPFHDTLVIYTDLYEKPTHESKHLWAYLSVFPSGAVAITGIQGHIEVFLELF